MKQLPADKSASKKIKIASSLFMGAAHLIYLKDYIKGTFYALCELGFIAALPLIVKKLTVFVTLGDPHPELPVRQRDMSTFMMIDGILVLTVIAVFAVLYVMSIKGAKKDYDE